MDYAFDYVKAKGITTETSYPYVGKDQTCKKDGGEFRITGYVDIAAGNTESLADSIVNQPVAVAMDASNWSFYAGGVFSNCGTSLNHGILAVGYDTTA